ncbi:hypothetical protein QUF56_10290 [Ureibacillus composti]|nr:hypothetical protein [Ureibacillus composti]
MNYKKVYENLIESSFYEVDFPASPGNFILSEEQTITQDFINGLVDQIEYRLVELNGITTTYKDHQYEIDSEIFKLTYLLDCLYSNEIHDLVNFKGIDVDPPIDIEDAGAYIYERNVEAYQDILDQANSHMHTIRIILGELCDASKDL